MKLSRFFGGTAFWVIALCVLVGYLEVVNFYFFASTNASEFLCPVCAHSFPRPPLFNILVLLGPLNALIYGFLATLIFRSCSVILRKGQR